MSDARKQTVLLVDGYSLIFRGFHALPLLTAPDGTYTNAVHGFFSMLIKALGEYRPDGLCVMMDMHAPTSRHTLYDGYKATRKPMPEELRPQLPLVRQMLEAMHVRICELEGYEADDLLGTAARLANERGIHAYVLTGDRDSLQLVGGETEIILTRKGITESLRLDAQGVYDTYGFTPAQVPDMKGLMGDSSDNIPGIPGVGEKTALKLITEYGSLDGVLEHADQVKGKLGEKLRAGRELALLSRELGTICRMVHGLSPEEPGAHREAHILLDWMVLQLARSLLHSSQAAHTAANDAGAQLVRQCIEHLRRVPPREFSVSELCEFAHVTQSYLYKCFQREMNCSPQKFLTLYRLKLAERELCDSSATIQELAEQFGYTSAGAFSQAFKQHFSVSPAAWRQGQRDRTHREPD